MAVLIFAGPTLSGDPLKETAGFTFLPPAAHGDVYRAALTSPKVIGLIDGYFETIPAVWHKEILFALSRGIHVYGAASMGALRASELWQFGMVGVGAVFESYRDNLIEDDDEVAVTHGPVELDYIPLSEAMVNVRATIASALSAGILRPSSAQAMLNLAKATFYKERTWQRLLNVLRGGVSAPERDAFGAWLPAGFVDRKRLDARLMLEEISSQLRSDPPPLKPHFEFHNTLDWEQAVREFRRLP